MSQKKVVAMVDVVIMKDEFLLRERCASGEIEGKQYALTNAPGATVVEIERTYYEFPWRGMVEAAYEMHCERVEDGEAGTQ